MQQHKSTNKFSEIVVYAKDSEALTITLSEVIGKLKIKTNLAPFDIFKSEGVAISGKVRILVILPFYGLSSVYAFY